MHACMCSHVNERFDCLCVCMYDVCIWLVRYVSSIWNLSASPSSYAMLDNVKDTDGDLESDQADDVPLRLGGLLVVQHLQKEA